MRVTFGQYRSGIKDPTSVTAGFPAHDFPSPWAIAAKSVRTFHVEGETQARQGLERGFSGYWSSTAQARGWAAAIKQCFENYARMSAPDVRSVFTVGFKGVLDIGNDQLSLYVDVLLLNATGYVGRVVLWDDFSYTRSHASLLATPVAAALGNELGEERIAGVEIWHLRTGTQHWIAADEALARRAEMNNLIASFVEANG